MCGPKHVVIATRSTFGRREEVRCIEAPTPYDQSTKHPRFATSSTIELLLCRSSYGSCIVQNVLLTNTRKVHCSITALGIHPQHCRPIPTYAPIGKDMTTCTLSSTSFPHLSLHDQPTSITPPRELPVDGPWPSSILRCKFRIRPYDASFGPRRSRNTKMCNRHPRSPCSAVRESGIAPERSGGCGTARQKTMPKR
jgi:hypothetical protein